MGHIEQGGERVFDHVVGVTKARRPRIGQAVQCQGRRPGELGAGVVIFGVCQQLLRGLQHGGDDGLHQAGLDCRLHLGGEVALDGVGYDVRRRVDQIVARDRLHQRRIDDGDFREGVHRVDGELLFGVIVGHHGAAVHLAAGGSQGQDGKHRQRRLDLPLADEQIPDIPLIEAACGNGLGAVEH
ncbi:hypothetical protein D3C77_317590 [compost metagenome]